MSILQSLNTPYMNNIYVLHKSNMSYIFTGCIMQVTQHWANSTQWLPKTPEYTLPFVLVSVVMGTVSSKSQGVFVVPE